MKDVVAEPSLQNKHHFETGEVPGGIDLGAIGRVITDQRQLGQLNVLVHDQRHVRIPLENHVVRGV